MTNNAPNFEDNKPNKLKSNAVNKLKKLINKPNNDWRTAMNRSPQVLTYLVTNLLHHSLFS